MPRPRIPIGGRGEITTRLVGDRYEATCYYRDKDGRLKEVSRLRTTQSAARAAVNDRLTRIIEEIHSGKVTVDTRFATVAEAWLGEFVEKAALGGKSTNSARLYKGYLRNHILPRIGALTMDEVRPSTLDGLIKSVRRTHSAATAKSVRSVLGGIGGYAVLQGLWDVNRAHQVGEIVSDDPKAVKALDLAELEQVRAAIARLAQERQTDRLGRSIGARGTVWTQLPDMIDASVSTGIRLGELLALTGPDFHFDARGRPVVAVEAHIVRAVDGEVVRLMYRKGSKSWLLLRVPQWSVPMWSRLKLAAGGGPMFRGMRGGLLHPDQVSKLLGQALDDAGWEWVTAHVLRKTVGDHLDGEGMSAEQVAAQLGNTAKVARKHYTRNRARNDEQAAALEGLGRKGSDVG